MSRTISGLAAVTILLLLVGCARSDWIESTLVTVDVGGAWSGEWLGSGGGHNGTLNLTLKQSGSKVSGDVTIAAARFLGTRRTVTGNIGGDRVTLSQEDGEWRFELTVNGDEMSGTASNFLGNARVMLRRGR